MDTLSKVQSMLSMEFDLPMERLQPGQSLEELGIDSLATIEFIFALEDRFSISLSDERTPVTTVNDIAALVDSVIQGQTHPA